MGLETGMGALAAVYSEADGLKRKLRDLLAQPDAYAEQVAGQIRDTMRDRPAEAVLEQWGPGAGTKALAGILRQGGDPRLVGLHQIGLDKLLPWLSNGKLPREVYSPSVALNKHDVAQNFGELSLVMRPDALDPVRVPGKIWNRDAYTPRHNQYRGDLADNVMDTAQQFREVGDDAGRLDSVTGAAWRRMQDRFALASSGMPEDVRLLEGFGQHMPYSQQKAILASPTMNSFKEFERNPRGAAIIDPSADVSQRSRNIDRAFWLAAGEFKDNPLLQVINTMRTEPHSIVNDLFRYKQLAEKFGEVTPEHMGELKDLLNGADRAYAHLPSNYGELKVRGPVRLDATNWAGAVLNNGTGVNQQEMAALKDILAFRGIPLLHGYEGLFDKAKLLSERARPVYGR